MEQNTSDFIIIGAGIAGTSAAWRLSTHGKVIVLEKEKLPGYHTTGRSAAFFTTNYGNQTIRNLTKASYKFFINPPKNFNNYPLIHKGSGTIFIGNKKQSKSIDKEIIKNMNSDTRISEISLGKVFQLAPMLRKNYVSRALLEKDSMYMDVNELHQSFIRGIVKTKNEIICNAEVKKIEKNKNIWTLKTSKGDFKSPIIINAAGAWSDHIGKLANGSTIGLKPFRRTVIVFNHNKKNYGNLWPLIIDIDENFYFKPESGNVLASPADETPTIPCDVQPEEIDVALTIENVKTTTKFNINKIIKKWAGLRSFVPDRTPVVGEDPKLKGFFWLAGQGGYGIMTSPSISKIIECLITGRDWPKDLIYYNIKENSLSPYRLF